MTIERALQYIDKVRSCYGTKNFTRDSYAASQWFNVVRKALEQGSVIDKIYADIQKLRGCSCSCSDGIIDEVEDILDKYKWGGIDDEKTK